MNPIVLALRLACGPGHDALAPHIESAAAREAIDPMVLVVLASAESSCHARAVNRRTGAVGLMQILPQGSANPDHLTTAQLLDPKTNVDLGAAHLARLLELCGGLGGAFSIYHGKHREMKAGRKVCPVDDFSKNLMKRIKQLTEQVARALAPRVAMED
jgi:hypothetical protein